jgi:N-acetylglucosamine kinase-like BadF-type ATPase
MKVIVDSGSTKSDWVLVKDDGTQVAVHTMGFNPYFHSPERIHQELSKESFTRLIPVTEIEEVFYYGAGCPDENYRSIIREGLKRVFVKAKIEVQHDLLGAARATCGRTPGICGIMGTGSNSCAYDGEHITDNVTALAHVLGDEGGGVYLGKLLLQAYFYRELPQDLLQLFEVTYPEGKDAIIHRIYGEGQNVHIASFAEFLIRHKEHPEARKLIDQNIRDFARRHLKKYEGWRELPINLVGSIAGLLQEEIREVFAGEGLKLGVVVRKPIDRLVEFHSTRL